MTEPSITYGHGLLWDFEDNFLWKDCTVYTATGDGAGGSEDVQTVAAALTEANDYWNECYIKILSATNDIVGEIKRITDFDAATDTLVHGAFSDDTLTGDTFIIAPYEVDINGTDDLDVSTTNNDVLVLDYTHGDSTSGFKNLVNLGVSTTIYPKLYYRYKCSNGDVDFSINVTYDAGGSGGEVLSITNSTTWKTGSLTLTTAKTLDNILLNANTATGIIYIDYILVCAGEFTFPNADSITVVAPSDIVRTPYAGRVGRAPQTMGADDTKILITSNLDIGDWTRTGDAIAGEVFLDISHNGSIDEEWQWFKTGLGHEMKVRLEEPQFMYTEHAHRLNLTFYEYRLGSADEETYEERFDL